MEALRGRSHHSVGPSWATFHQSIHDRTDRDHPHAPRLAYDDLLVVRDAHLGSGFADRLRGHDPRGFVRVDRMQIELLANLGEDLVQTLLRELESVDLLRDFTHDGSREPPPDLLEPVGDLLLSRRQRRRLHRDREGRLGLRLRRLRGGLPDARGRLRPLFLRRGLRLRQYGSELLEDLLRLFLRDELREPFDLRGGELLEREARVRQQLGRLLRDPPVAQGLDRRGACHDHSSDGGSSSSTSTSSSEISTYMSFSVRPYEAISCSRRRSFHDGSSPRTSWRISSMSTARPWTLRLGSTPSSPNRNWMIVSAVLRTVPSSLTFRSSRALISRRCM